MATLRLPHGEIIAAPDGLTDAEYDAIVDNYYSSGKVEPTVEPGMLDSASAWFNENVVDPAGMNLLDATFGGKNLGKIVGDVVAAGGSPADIQSSIVSSIPKQLGKTVLNTVGGAAATLGDLGLSLPQYGIKGVDTALQLAGITEPATSGVPEDTQVVINPLTGQPTKVSAQGKDYSDDAKRLLELFSGPQEKIKEFHKGLREDTPLMSRNPIAETTTDLAAQGSDWLGEKVGIPAEQNPLSGATRSVGGLAGGLLTPENVLLTLPTLGAGPLASAAHKVLPAVFGPAAIEGAITEGGAAMDQAQQGSLAGTTEHGLNALLQGAFGAAMLKSLVPKGGGGKAPPPTPQALLDRAAPDMAGAPVPPGPTPPGAPITIENNIPRGNLRLPVTDMSALAGQGILPGTLPGAGPSPVVPSRAVTVPGTPANAYVSPPIKKIATGKHLQPPAPPPTAGKFGLPEDIATTMASMLQGQKFSPDIQTALRGMEKSVPSGRGVRSTAGNPKLRMVIDPVSPLIEPVMGKIKKMADDKKFKLPAFYGGLTKIEKQREAYEAAKNSVQDVATENTFNRLQKDMELLEQVKDTMPEDMWTKEMDALGSKIEDVHKEEMMKLLGAEYQEQLRKRAIVPGSTKDLQTKGPLASLKSWIRNTIPEFAKADRETGQEGALLLDKMDKLANREGFQHAKYIKMFEPAVKKLSKLQIDGKTASNLLEYVESQPDGTIHWNPEAYIVDGKVKIPAYTGAKPSPQVLEQLGIIRQGFDLIDSEIRAAGKDMGYHPRYVPRRSLLPRDTINELDMTGAPSGPSQGKSITDPAFTKERTWYEGEPMERDLAKLINTYTSQASKTLTYDKAFINQLLEQYHKYNWIGEPNRAKAFEQIINETLGIGKEGITKVQKQQLIDFWKANGEQALKQEMQRRGMSPSKLDNFLSEVRNQVAHTMIGLNPRNWVAQRFDTILRGSPDVPLVEILKSHRGFTPEELQLLEKERTSLRSDVYDPLSVDKAEHELGPKADMAAKVLRAPGAPGMRLVDMFESSEREHLFIAARRWWNKSASKDKLFEGLSPSDLQTVRDAMKSGGNEAAATEFARIKTNHVMGRYGKTNRPLGMRSGLGKMSMFTTFGIHELNKIYDDISAGRTGHAVKRVVNPILPALIIGSMTNQVPGLSDKGLLSNITYFHPMMGASQSTAMGAPPYLSLVKNAALQSSKDPTKLPKQLLKETAKMTPTTWLLSKGISGAIDGSGKGSAKAKSKRRPRSNRSR